MVSRPYKCPMCHSAFRNESGMQWHVAYRHETPAAFDALGMEYEAKTVSLQGENALLKEKNQELQTKLDQTMANLVQAQANLTEQLADNVRLLGERQQLVMAVALRDHLIKQKLGMQLPSPFKEP